MSIKTFEELEKKLEIYGFRHNDSLQNPACVDDSGLNLIEKGNGEATLRLHTDFGKFWSFPKAKYHLIFNLINSIKALKECEDE